MESTEPGAIQGPARPLVAQLRHHHRKQTAERLAAGSAWQDWDLVFAAPAGAPIDSRDDWADWHNLLPKRILMHTQIANPQFTALQRCGAAGTRTQDRRIMSPLL